MKSFHCGWATQGSLALWVNSTVISKLISTKSPDSSIFDVQIWIFEFSQMWGKPDKDWTEACVRNEGWKLNILLDKAEIC